jgi:adenylate cyclase
MLPALASLRLRALYTPLIAGALGALFAFSVQFAFDHGRIVLFTYPLLALALSAIGSIVVWYVLEAFERALTRDVFARFVPETVIDQVLALNGGELRLGGEKVFGTAMFTDLRGFTTFSETRSAEDVIEILNYYFGEMSEAVLGHGGTLVSYLGDGMMAVFGAPLDQADHADRALAAADEMIRVRLPRVNAWIAEQGFGEGFRMGIGLNSGRIMSGNIGSERRLEYTTIGDTVNTASRLEGMTKGTPYPLFIADSTRTLLAEQPHDLVFVAELELKGRSEKVKAWSLSGLAAADPLPSLEPGLVAQYEGP